MQRPDWLNNTYAQQMTGPAQTKDFLRAFLSGGGAPTMQQPFDQGGLTPPITAPPPTPVRPSGQASGWPTDLLGLLRNRGMVG